MKVISFFLAVSIAACTTTPSSPGVLLSVERVSPGVMRLTLDNGRFHPIGYNLCTSGLQQKDGASWTAVPTGDICTMELRTLNPGADATFEKTLPSRLPTGEYRYVTSVEDPVGTEQKGVASPPFSLP